MTLTYEQATDEMKTLFWAVWEPTGHNVHWDSKHEDRDPNQDPWCEFYVRHGPGRQITMGRPAQFQRRGTIVASIYIPGGNGLSESYQLAKVAADAFEGKSSPGGVWFRNVTINEIGMDGNFFQTSMLAEFEYCETK